MNFEKIFEGLKQNQHNVASTSRRVRCAKLKILRRAIEGNKKELQDAMYSDFKKHPTEVDLTEILPIVAEINHTIRNLRSWMQTKHVSTPWSLIGTSSYIKYEPKGVVLIISPWNFPINLTFGPLVLAIAAGNCVVLKPSEFTPHTARVMARIVDEVFNGNEVTVVEGGVDVSQALLNLPFNHIFFTGSPRVGKIVMKAAANHLASVTLELGGKSPAIIDSSASLAVAAKKIVWSKCMNAGQICIAPDYILIPQSMKDEFIKHVKKEYSTLYPDPARNGDMPLIVNDHHYDRLKKYLDEAKQKDGSVIELTEDSSHRFIGLTLVTNPPVDSLLMEEEIFGPILPVLTYNNIDEAIQYINDRARPLALYIFGNRNSVIKQILNRTRAGGTCINDCVIHYFNTHLPFGGVNNSGMGKTHGKFGFEEFSNLRGVLRQHLPKGINEIIYPPYTKFTDRLVGIIKNWLT